MIRFSRNQIIGALVLLGAILLIAAIRLFLSASQSLIVIVCFLFG